MNRNLPILILTIALALSAACYAGIDNQIGARGQGIGLSFSALADEPFGALFNPAGIAFSQGWQTQIQYSRPTRYGFTIEEESPYYGMVGANYRLNRIGNLAFNFNQVGSTSNPTTVTTTSAASLSYARLLMPTLSGGASIKYMFETNFSERKAVDFDLGVSYRPDANYTVSAAAENILNSKYTPDWHNTTQHMDRNYRVSGGYFIPLNNITGAVLAGWQMTQGGEAKTISTSLMNFGTEWWIGTNSNFAIGVRGGYTTGQAVLNEQKEDYSRLHAGLSLDFNVAGRDMRLDYGFRTYPFEGNDEMNADHTFALSYGFGGVPDYGKKRNNEAKQVAHHEQTKVSPLPPPPAESQTQPVAPVTIAPVTPPVEQVAPVTPQVNVPATPTGSMPAYQRPETGEYLKLSLNLDVSDISMGEDRRIIFYLRPVKIVKLTSWKLFIFKARLKDWSEEKAQAFSLHEIEGKGIPPINVIWNGVLNDGMMVPSGKYYFVLSGEDKFGQKYLSDWCKFGIN
jgi:hypothetical protein